MIAPGAHATSAAIVVDGLVKRYGDRTILDGIGFEVAHGELFALLGPNGAGKTTTVEIIEGYRAPDEGSVEVVGIDVRRGGRELRARVGLMLQDGGVDPRARPDEILRLYAAFHADPDDPSRLIELVGLGQAARTRYRRLSGGERQRLGLALALVGRPEVLVLDEPTAGMDPEARARTRELLMSLRQAGATILLTTHDLVDVERLADRVGILDRGRIVALGSPAQLVAGVRPGLVIRFGRALAEADRRSLAAVLTPDAAVSRTAGDPRLVELAGIAADPSMIARIAAWAAHHRLLIAELRTSGGTLEDRYLQLTGDATARTTDRGDVA